jgi:hypothetical protein
MENFVTDLTGFPSPLNISQQRFSRTFYTKTTGRNTLIEESEPSSVQWEATDSRDRGNEHHGVKSD